MIETVIHKVAASQMIKTINGVATSMPNTDLEGGVKCGIKSHVYTQNKTLGWAEVNCERCIKSAS